MPTKKTTTAKPATMAKSPFAGELEPLAGGDVLTKPVEEMSVPERSQSHSILKFLAKRIETRLKELHGPLLADAQKHGEPVIGTDGKPTGSKKLYVEGSKIYDKYSRGKEPDYAKMTDLLAAKSIAVERAYDEIKTYAYSPSKVEKLISTGFLKEKDVLDLCKEVHSLVVEASPELAALLETAHTAALPSSDK